MGPFAIAAWLCVGVHVLWGANAVGDHVTAGIRAGTQPPIEVLPAQGFEWHRAESLKKRKAFFETHEQLGDGTWIPKATKQSIEAEFKKNHLSAVQP